MTKFLLGSLLTLNSFAAFGEYRVYQYLIKSTHYKAQDQNAYIVTSTLDPVSYRAYKSGSLNVKVDLMRTWTCVGYTGYMGDHCTSPYEALKSEVANQGKTL